MKRKWQIVMALVLSLVTIIIATLPVLGQAEEPANTDSTSRGALAIIAPWTVPADQEFTVRAFLRENQEPFPGAGVWAISADADATLREALGGLQDEPARSSAETDYEGILNTNALFLGRTGQDGRLACTLDEPGKYILVAARN